MQAKLAALGLDGTTAVIALLVVLGLALLITAIVLVVRARRRAPAAPVPASLASVWDRFRQRLPASARGDPVIVVLGDRLAGKSTSVLAGLELDTRPALAAQEAPDDPRLTCFAGRGALVQEISGDVLADTRPESLDALRALWRPSALDVPLVICVLDTRAPTWSPAGLKRLGGLARDKIDLLTKLRGSAPRVRVCLTHLDASAEGFVELAAVARRAGHTAALSPAGPAEAQLSASVAVLSPYVSQALRERSPAELGKVARFCDATGPRLVSAAAPFLDALLAARPDVGAPSLAGVVLSGGSAATMIGDPLVLDAAAIDRDTRALDRRRTIAAVAAVAAAAALLGALYAWHAYAIDRAGKAVARFSEAARSAMSAPPGGWASDTAAIAAEAAAADDADSALAPLFPLLRVAYPTRTQKLEHDVADKLVQPIRELYLFPAAQAPDRGRRILALSLLYAPNDEALGDLVRGGADAWAEGLQIPRRVVLDYLAWSEHPWRGAPPAPPASDDQVALKRWQDWLRSVDEALSRGRLQREELDPIQATGRDLLASVAGALEVRGLDDVQKRLRAAAGRDLDPFLGSGARSSLTPEWVTENWESVESVLALVLRSSLAVPSVGGKNLRRAVSDLEAIGHGDPADPDAQYSIVVGSETKVYRPEAWARVIRASRASIYVKAFLRDVSQTHRSLFFERPADYPPVMKGAGRSHGPLRSLSGTSTASAVGADVRPAILGLAALDPALIPADDRAELDRTVRAETAVYGRDYRAALVDYVTSFHLDVTSPAGLRGELEDMVGPASWFTDFWVSVAENAAVDPAGNDQLQILADALAPFQPIVAVMAGEKGKYPVLDAYYAVLAPVVPLIDASAPLPPGPAEAALEDRLPPLGKLGLTLLETDKPAPLTQAIAWLDKSRLLDRSLRQPFIVPVELIYTYALQNVEKTIDQAYREQLRPIVTPLFARFPLDPRGTLDAVPDDLLAALGPKGSFRVGLDALLAPVCKAKKTNDPSCVPKAPAGFRAVRLPGEALDLTVWSAVFATALWDDGGKPRSLALTARPRALAEARPDDRSAVTRSFLRSGGTTVFGFNQAPAWQALPVPWSTSAAAGVGMERTAVGGEAVPQSIEAEGSAWRFYHLLCRAPTRPDATFTWPFEPPVSFDITPDPWSLVVPPPNRGHRCVQLVASR